MEDPSGSATSALCLGQLKLQRRGETSYHKFIPQNGILGRERLRMDSNLVNSFYEKRECWPLKISIFFSPCFLNVKIGHGNAAVFHFVVF